MKCFGLIAHLLEPLQLILDDRAEVVVMLRICVYGQ